MKSIFEEYDINPNAPIVDEAKALMELISDNPEEFKKVSERAIELGVVEKLSPSGYVQAIQNLAHQVFIISLGMNFSNIPMEEDTSEYYNYPGIGEDLSQLDKILNMIAFSSGKHWEIVSKDLDVWLDYYAEKFGNDLRNKLN